MESWLDSVQPGNWHTLAMGWGVRALLALLLLLVGMRVARWIAGIAEKGLARAEVEPTAVLFLRKVAYVVLLVVLVLASLQVIGVPMTSMIAVLGAAGLAIGLALKDSLSNIASGVMLVSLKPFRVGDIVTIAGATGKVEQVSIFQTRLRGADNQAIVLPNSLITADSIVNLTPDTMRRIELVVGIGYQDDIEAARAAALAVMRGDPRVLPRPEPDVLVYALGDSSVQLGIRCHVSNDDHFVTRCELTERIKHAFDDAGISIPFPQRDVHMFHHAAPDAAGGGQPRLLRGDRAERTGLDSPQHRPAADPE
ncbi:mechanosensitive ion channel family protein [Luteimonas sp. 50]|uniref:Small-conductance mechanosensitive channel n=1 Tax=Cognatiluteimonas sedimenti TaxID=2927791 RepID=A0ABT0A1C2_9GAMM|nr:mechanosensitive ion channel family protein [Lysobacter sedimenti]MCJ0824769.1 mechanosensitive ion channel family protein [Lysobacter sedimenti]